MRQGSHEHSADHAPPAGPQPAAKKLIPCELTVDGHHEVVTPSVSNITSSTHNAPQLESPWHNARKDPSPRRGPLDAFALLAVLLKLAIRPAAGVSN